MIPLKQFIRTDLKRQSNVFLTSRIRQLTPILLNVRQKQNKSDASIHSMFKETPVKRVAYSQVGKELCGNLKKVDVIKTLVTFAQTKSIMDCTLKYGIDETLLRRVLSSFRSYCLNSTIIPVDLYVTLSDIINGAGNISDLLPYFLRHAKEIFPHLECIDDLKQISDLRNPANWYPVARERRRKIIFHGGPTNSGKTYRALQCFLKAQTAVYCGPLKLLATEVFNKSNAEGIPCDLVTGEDKRYANDEQKPANHVACSIEMVNLQSIYEVAVIDEIQLIRDPSRGWAWTRALLGVVADEIHLCGELAALSIVQSLCESTNDTIEVKSYKRLTDLEIENKALISIQNVEPGDCIVCFNKNDIFEVSNSIRDLGKQVAVIYGSLPPGTKQEQASKFNDVNDRYNVLVATNAIGMGLNLCIRRIIFYSLVQPILNDKGEKEMEVISVSTALQIAGRAGRHGTQFTKGYVTTFFSSDLPVLRKLLRQSPEEVTHAGLHPTADQIELYAYYLPNTTLSDLLDIFIMMSKVDDSMYFICNLNDFKYLADLIQHIPLPLRMRYVFCCAPINKKMPLSCSMFLKFARRCSKSEKVTCEWTFKQISWPLAEPQSLSDLVYHECVFDIFESYLWLSYRFVDLFPDANLIRQAQATLDNDIRRCFSTLIQGSAAKNQEKEPEVPQGKLTEQLISQGLLTPRMLRQLQAEWIRKGKTPKYPKS